MSSDVFCTHHSPAHCLCDEVFSQVDLMNADKKLMVLINHLEAHIQMFAFSIVVSALLLLLRIFFIRIAHLTA